MFAVKWLAYLFHTLSRTDRIEKNGQTSQMNQIPATLRERFLSHLFIGFEGKVARAYWLPMRKQSRARRSREWKWHPCLGLCFGW